MFALVGRLPVPFPGSGTRGADIPRHFGERQGVQVPALDVCTTMGYQVRFSKAGLGLLPLLERTDRDLLFEQRSRSRRGEAMTIHFALRTQQAICRRCAHGEKLAAALLSEVEVLMPLQRLNERREKGHEPFGTNPVGGIPCQEQGMLDFWSELASAWARRCLLRHLCMIVEPNGVFAVIASGLGEFITMYRESVSWMAKS